MYNNTSVNLRRYILINRKYKKPLTFYEKIVKNLSFLKYPVPSFIKNSYKYSIFHNKYLVDEKQMFSAPINLFLLMLLFGTIVYLSLSITQPKAALDIFYGILLTGLTLSIYLFIYPKFYERIVKTVVTSESIWVLTFMIIYLRRIPNIERAIEFVAAYLDGYIASEFADIIYDVETKRFSNLDKAIDYYSKRWVEWNNDFAYSISLILATRYIRDPIRVQKLLDRVLEWYIKSSNERILVFSSYLKPKVTVIAMFAIMLPLIGIIMFPILATFMPESVRFSLLFYIYDVFLPVISYILIQTIIAQKPFAFSVSNLSLVPNLPKPGYFKFLGKEIPIFPIAFSIAIIFSIPSIIHIINLAILLYRLPDDSPIYIGILKQEFSIGPILTVYSMVFGLGLALGLYYYLNSFQKIKIIREIEAIEEELPMMITIIENSLYSGIPLEKTIVKVSENYRVVYPNGKLTKFLDIIITNIYKFGMTLREAVFNKKNGAVLFYPSLLLREVMNLLVSAAEKSIESIINVAQKISRHLEEINSLKKRMISELADSIGTLKIVLSVIVPLFGSMTMVSQKFILQVIIFMIEALKSLEVGLPGQGGYIDSFLKEVIDIDKTIPVTAYIIPVGIYLIEIIIITGYFLSGILYGFDKTNRDYIIGKALLTNILVITILIVSGLAMVKYLFNLFSSI